MTLDVTMHAITNQRNNLQETKFQFFRIIPASLSEEFFFFREKRRKKDRWKPLLAQQGLRALQCKYRRGGMVRRNILTGWIMQQVYVWIIMNIPLRFVTLMHGQPLTLDLCINFSRRNLCLIFLTDASSAKRCHAIKQTPPHFHSILKIYHLVIFQNFSSFIF